VGLEIVEDEDEKVFVVMVVSDSLHVGSAPADLPQEWE
jgi:hypothetical protein